MQSKKKTSVKNKVVIHTPSEKKLKTLSSGVGDFINYWGFRRIHGEIWTQIFLSVEPLSGADLVKRLGVSKALVSPGLKELEEHGLVFQIKSEDERVKRYKAHEDYMSVISNVLKTRELPMIARTLEDLNQFKTESEKNNHIGIDSARFQVLENMISSAHMFISSLVTMGEMNMLNDIQFPSFDKK
jgi:DNA-binding transcriptional regulator GbsR (MarR family)